MGEVPNEALEALYAVPLSAFTRERNARAAALAKAGQAAAAEAVKGLRRPPAWLWVTNQLGRLDGQRVAAFLEAATRIRATQLRDPQAAADTAQQHRAHLGALLQRARDVLRREGHQVNPALERRISNTLLGAAADRRLADDLRHGRLTSEVQAPGFEALFGAPGAGRRPLAKSAGKAGPGKAPPNVPLVSAREEEEEERRRQRARALADEAAAREAAARALESEIAAATTALTEQQHRLQSARREARRAAAAARRADKTRR